VIVIAVGWIGAHRLEVMKQVTPATVGDFERYAKATRRAAFLAEMERVVRSALCASSCSIRSRAMAGPPVGVERALRFYLLLKRYSSCC
jgi:hypothetical protein